MLDVVWLNLVELSRHKTFREILPSVASAEKDWKKWFDSDAPEEEDIPCGYQASLDVFRRLLLVRSWCPDRTLSQARKYIHSSLGADFLESAVLDIEVMLEESDNKVPLICLLSTGSDPSGQIENIAKVGEEHRGVVMLGAGARTGVQEPRARTGG
jgi:dynein heavy chain